MLASSLLPARCHTYTILSYQGSTIISCLQLIPKQPRAGWHQKLNLCLQALSFFSWPWLFLGIGCFVSRYFSFGICHLMLWLWPHPEHFLSPRHWWASGNSLEFLNRHHKLHEDKLVFALETTQNHKPLSPRGTGQWHLLGFKYPSLSLFPVTNRCEDLPNRIGARCILPRAHPRSLNKSYPE